MQKFSFKEDQPVVQMILLIFGSLSLLLVALAVFLVALVWIFTRPGNAVQETTTEVLIPADTKPTVATIELWQAPSQSTLEGNPEAELIKYGRELIAHTAKYYGPKGQLVANATNGLNCQNCHLDAGTKPYGNNYSAVASTYPKYRGRSGAEEDIPKRVNDCFERSLNGKPISKNSKEMKAIVAYIQWLGEGVPKGTKPKGSGLKELDYLDVAANPELGKPLYKLHCASCHGTEGLGVYNEASGEYTYPPLNGPNSYNVGAGLYRISTMARYIKYNMPLGVNHDNPLLSDEEAWHIAAYVNSLDHPKKDLSKDWPKIEEKPIDHPFGPFADTFTEVQHKYGPFKPILATKK